MTPITTFPSLPAPCFLSVCKEKDMFVAIRNRGEESGNIIQNRETSSFITVSLNEKEKGILGSRRKEAEAHSPAETWGHSIPERSDAFAWWAVSCPQVHMCLCGSGSVYKEYGARAGYMLNRSVTLSI